MRRRAGRPRRAKKRPKCKINKVWGYPATGITVARGIDNPVIDFAWSCKCGRHNSAIVTRERAEAEAAAHLEGTPS